MTVDAKLEDSSNSGEECQASKIYVLDTSVVLYDGKSLHSFDEHDVAVPLTVLEELDQFKKGSSVMNLQAREFIRRLDDLSGGDLLQEWIPLNGPKSGRIRVVPDQPGRKSAPELDATKVFGTHKNDHRILNAVMRLQEIESDRAVVLVSKDINLRLKARALSIRAEDYETIQIRDTAQLHRGHTILEVEDDGPVDRLYADEELSTESLGLEGDLANHYLVIKSYRKSCLAWVNPTTGQVERVNKEPAYGITPKNAEQTFALHAILNPQAQLVTLSGAAGTGKTLIALAGALEQRRSFRQIYLARPIVPLSNRDIGFLPGDVKSKINPFMQPLFDNLAFIKSQYEPADKEFRRVDDMIEKDKLHVVPLAYIRGRSLTRVLFIVDEAQNLTPHEIKTIITRAGEGTKIILTGDVFQIDTPYLDARSNGLSYLIDRLHGHPMHAHINLEKGVRSPLANLASELL